MAPDTLPRQSLSDCPSLPQSLTPSLPHSLQLVLFPLPSAVIMHTFRPTSGNAQGAWLGGRTSYALQPARVRLNAVHWGASRVAAAYMRSRFPSRHTPMKPVPKFPISGCHSLAPLLVADPVSGATSFLAFSIVSPARASASRSSDSVRGFVS